MPADAALFLETITGLAASEIVHRDDECDPADCTPHGALRMAAALKAVLKLADEAQQYDTFGSGDMHWDITPDEIREAITTRLLGEGGRRWPMTQ